MKKRLLAFVMALAFILMQTEPVNAADLAKVDYGPLYMRRPDGQYLCYRARFSTANGIITALYDDKK